MSDWDRQFRKDTRCEEVTKHHYLAIQKFMCHDGAYEDDEDFNDGKQKSILAENTLLLIFFFFFISWVGWWEHLESAAVFLQCLLFLVLIQEFFLNCQPQIMYC